MKKTNTFLSIFVFYVIINMVLFPALYIKQSLNGLSAWAFNVLPSVLPFMFFTKLLSSLGALDKVSNVFQKPCAKFYKVNKASMVVFLTSIISGYPVGAKMTADLYSQGIISRQDAFKMNSFCSTSGPMFIIGAVGVGMLGNIKYGYIIFISHVLGALLNGFLYRNLKAEELENSRTSVTKKSKTDISSLILDSALSIISVGAIISIFFVITTALLPILNLLPSTLSCLTKGIIEITQGCIEISSLIKSKWSILASTFIISFGGLSTLLQSLTMLSPVKMPVKLIVKQKLTHAILSSMLAIIFILII